MNCVGCGRVFQDQVGVKLVACVNNTDWTKSRQARQGRIWQKEKKAPPLRFWWTVCAMCPAITAPLFKWTNNNNKKQVQRRDQNSLNNRTEQNILATRDIIKCFAVGPHSHLHLHSQRVIEPPVRCTMHKSMPPTLKSPFYEVCLLWFYCRWNANAIIRLLLLLLLVAKSMAPIDTEHTAHRAPTPAVICELQIYFCQHSVIDCISIDLNLGSFNVSDRCGSRAFEPFGSLRRSRRLENSQMAHGAARAHSEMPQRRKWNGIRCERQSTFDK